MIALRRKWGGYKDPVFTADQLAAIVVARAERDGTIETLQAQVETLTEIVGFLVTQLDEGSLCDLAERHGYERSRT
jgi:hypothetical protein